MSSSKAWTEGEKLGLLFQIIAKSGPIPWAELTLPDGRTKKACDVMIFKEKEKLKKAREVAAAGEGENDDATATTGKGSAIKKRGATTGEDGEGGESPVKKAKAKAPRKKKGEKAAAVVAAEDDDEEGVKVEVDMS